MLKGRMMTNFLDMIKCSLEPRPFGSTVVKETARVLPTGCVSLTC